MKTEIARARRIVAPVALRTLALSRRPLIGFTLAAAAAVILWIATVPLPITAIFAALSAVLLAIWAFVLPSAWRRAEIELRNEAKNEADAAVAQIRAWDAKRKREEHERWEREFGVKTKERDIEKLLDTMRLRHERAQRAREDRPVTYHRLHALRRKQKPPRFPVGAIFLAVFVALIPTVLRVFLAFANHALSIPPSTLR